MKINYDTIKKIESKVGSPFYISYLDIFEQNISDIHEAFLNYYDNVILGYSYKTNYLPSFCKKVKEHNGWAEVVSRMEYDLALKVGCSGENIIFNGPLKKREDIFKAFKLGSIVNIDALYEIDYLADFLKENPNLKEKIRIGIRLNIVLQDNEGNSVIQEGIKIGRFGFSNFSGDLDKVIMQIESLGVKIKSIHGHASSNNRRVENYELIVNTICDVLEKYELFDIEFIDVGGGYLGPIPKCWNFEYQPSFDEYAKKIIGTLKEREWFNKIKPALVIEPGVSVVANTISFVSKVYAKKNHQGTNFVVLDGSIYNVKPTFHSLNLPHYVVTNNSIEKEGLKPETYDIVGSTCMEKDIMLSQVELNNISVEDYIVFDNIGAYTIVMTPPFINLYPAIVEIDKDGIKIVREAQTTEDFLLNYKI